jgi:hypothetical protein
MIRPSYDQADHFSESLAAVEIDKVSTYIDHKNDIVWSKSAHCANNIGQ